MMNLSELLTSIKMKLGIYGLSLPLDDLDEQLHNVIKLETIKTYSQFFPQTFTLEYSLNELEVLTKSYMRTTVVLPDIFAGRHIMGVRDVFPGKMDQGANHMYPELAPGDSFFESIMLGHAYSHLTSAVSPPFSFDFEHPNIVHLFNFASYTQHLTFKIDVEHFNNLSSIPPTQWEAFKTLSILDVKIYLFGILKHYTDLTTAIGTINLKIDDWADAQSQRDQLIENWTASYHLEGQAIYFI